MKLKYLKHDIIDQETGLFISSSIYNENDEKLRCFSRAGMLWSDINKRCGNVGGKNPRYADVVNDFMDFQDFADWANSQYGYLNMEPSGNMWAIDKDIILQGNKRYCPELCLFVPKRVNGLFISNVSKRGSFPLGVSFDNKALRLRASCRSYINGKSVSVHLGFFDLEEDAHRAWQKRKIHVIENVANEYKYHKKLYYALLNRADMIKQDYSSYAITDWG